MPTGERDDELIAPLDAADPRFVGSEDARRRASGRRLVESRGPGSSQMDPRVRTLRVLIPAAFLTAIVVVVGVFAVGLDPGDGRVVLGSEREIRAAVAARPHRVCYREQMPCAWIALVDGELVAFNTNGPLTNEYGRLGVAWCATSGHYGSNATGSRFDQRGNVVRGPAPRGLDRFGLQLIEGEVLIDFFKLSTGLQVGRADELLPPAGPQCEQIPFDRDADLELDTR